LVRRDLKNCAAKQKKRAVENSTVLTMIRRRANC
jgi:hypothetical protein